MRALAVWIVLPSFMLGGISAPIPGEQTPKGAPNGSQSLPLYQLSEFKEERKPSSLSKNPQIQALFPRVTSCVTLEEETRSDEMRAYKGDATSQILGVAGERAVGASWNTPGVFGFIPGEALRSEFAYHPLVWKLTPDRKHLSQAPSLLSLPEGSNRAVALDINEAGDVVGQAGSLVISSTPSPHGMEYISYGVMNPQNSPRYLFDKKPRSILWKADGRIELLSPFPGDVRCVAKSINSKGDVVGWSVLPNNKLFTTRAVLWRQGKPLDLSQCVAANPKPTLSSAIIINDEGQILAQYVDGKRLHYVLLNPMAEHTQ